MSSAASVIVTAPRRRAVRLDLFAYCLVLPAFLFEAAFVYWPILLGVASSLREKGTLSFAAYHRMLFEDPAFWTMMATTLEYTILVEVLTVAAGLAVALLMNMEFEARGVIRSVLTIPWAMPEVPVAIAFLFMLDPQFGVANRLARLLPGVNENPQWLLDPNLAMAAVVVVSVWKAFPFYSMVILSALQGVPSELYEAARMDGAGVWSRFRHVTVPGIRGTLALLAVLAFIYAIQQFTLIWLITGGGPVDATSTVSLGIYIQAFRFYDYTYAGAIAVAAFLLSAIATGAFVVAQRSLDRKSAH